MERQKNILERNRETIETTYLILNNLNSWMEKTTFSNIKYDWAKAEPINHKDPELDYLDETIEILKEHNAYILWKKGKIQSESLVDDGITAIQCFHNVVSEKLENLQLKELWEIGRILSVPYYSVPRVRQAIFKEVNGEH